jgi:hypothetical protein
MFASVGTLGSVAVERSTRGPGLLGTEAVPSQFGSRGAEVEGESGVERHAEMTDSAPEAIAVTGATPSNWPLSP